MLSSGSPSLSKMTCQCWYLCIWAWSPKLEVHILPHSQQVTAVLGFCTALSCQSLFIQALQLAFLKLFVTLAYSSRLAGLGLGFATHQQPCRRNGITTARQTWSRSRCPAHAMLVYGGARMPDLLSKYGIESQHPVWLWRVLASIHMLGGGRVVFRSSRRNRTKPCSMPSLWSIPSTKPVGEGINVVCL